MNTTLKIIRHTVDHLLYTKHSRLLYWFFQQLTEYSTHDFDSDSLAFWGFLHHPKAMIWPLPNVEQAEALGALLIENAEAEGSLFGTLLLAMDFHPMLEETDKRNLDVALAVQHLQGMEQQGHPFAALVLGLWEEYQGRDGKNYFDKAARMGGALFQRARFAVVNGLDIDPKDLEEGIGYERITHQGWIELEKQAKAGIGFYAYVLGKRCELAGNYKKALAWYEEGAKASHPLALRALGDFYYINYHVDEVVPNDYERGLVYYERAAELGDRYSAIQAAYGNVSRFGDIEQDWGRAMYWIREMWNRDDNGDALPYLGYALTHGRGVEKDVETGYELLLEAEAEEARRAASGDFQYPPRIRALWRNALGYLHESKEVKRRNFKKAYGYYEESAKIYEDIRARWPGLDMSDDEGKERLTQLVKDTAGKVTYKKGIKVTQSKGNSASCGKPRDWIVQVAERGWGDDYRPSYATSIWDAEAMKREVLAIGRLVFTAVNGSLGCGGDEFDLISEVQMVKGDDGRYTVKLITVDDFNVEEEDLVGLDMVEIMGLMESTSASEFRIKTATMDEETLLSWVDLLFTNYHDCMGTQFGWEVSREPKGDMTLWESANPLWIVKFKGYYEGIFSEELGRLLVDEYLSRLGRGMREPLLIMSPTEEKPSIRIEDLSDEGQSPNYHLLLAYVTKQGILDYEAMSPHIDLVKAEALSIMQGEPAGKYLEIHERLEETPPLH